MSGHNLPQILNEGRTKGFPELSDRHIMTRWIISSQGFDLRTPLPPFWNFYDIGVNADLGTAPIEVIQGGIAHELAEVRSHVIFGRVKSALGSLHSYFSPNHRNNVEEAIDTVVIVRGYGPQLAVAFEYLDKQIPKQSKIGLSPEKIREFAADIAHIRQPAS